MPHICIVDKFGAINFNGEAKLVDLVSKVDELIAANSVTKSEPNKNENMMEAEKEYDLIKNLLQSSNNDSGF